MPLVLDANLLKAMTPVSIGILTPSIGGVLNMFMIRRNKLWYKKLRKPVWTPPGDSFRPIWHNIYSLTGYASFMVWRDGGGFSGSLVVRKNLNPWYAGLKKPDWRPPNWAFGPVWTGLYCSMGYASYMVYREGGFSGPAKLPLILYGGQLALNWAWSPIFFGGHKLKLAFYEILALDVAAAGTACAFYKVSKSAGLMFIPYLMWLGLATTLSYRIWRDNPEEEKDEVHRND